MNNMSERVSPIRDTPLSGNYELPQVFINDQKLIDQIKFEKDYTRPAAHTPTTAITGANYDQRSLTSNNHYPQESPLKKIPLSNAISFSDNNFPQDSLMHNTSIQ